MKNTRARGGKPFGVAIMVGGVYQIRSHSSSAVYIGQSEDIPERFYMHRLALKRGNHASKLLQAEYDRYSTRGLCFEFLQLENDRARRQLAEYEWINHLKLSGAILLNAARTLDYPVPTLAGHLVANPK